MTPGRKSTDHIKKTEYYGLILTNCRTITRMSAQDLPLYEDRGGHQGYALANAVTLGRLDRWREEVMFASLNVSIAYTVWWVSSDEVSDLQFERRSATSVSDMVDFSRKMCIETNEGFAVVVAGAWINLHRPLREDNCGHISKGVILEISQPGSHARYIAVYKRAGYMTDTDIKRWARSTYEEADQDRCAFRHSGKDYESLFPWTLF